MNPLSGSALRARVLLLIILSLPWLAQLPAHAAGAPAKIWITLKDKGPAVIGNPTGASAGARNPLSAAQSRAYENSPVYAPYLQALHALGFTPAARLKWQNSVSGYADAAAWPALRRLPFVAGLSLMPRKAKAPPLPFSPFAWKPNALAKRAAEGLEYGAGRALMESLHVDKVHAYLTANGMSAGQGMRVAVIDADFHLGSPIFAAMRARIQDQYDFVADKPIAVTDSFLSSHGAECMSLIGGNSPGTLVGAAPEAGFLLYRAEDDDNETYVEEDYVAEAVERAVDSGAQVISISLGYRYEFSDGSPDVPYAEFDGRTRPSSLAVLGAARRNVLVSVAVGNLPDSLPALPSLSAPADADSILAVGIADRFHRKCGYSCTGPSADGRVKPDIMSLGLAGECQVAVANTQSHLESVNAFAGTSFAAPVIAGIATLLRQLRPEATAEEIRQALITTADRYARPDSGSGYGVANATAAAQKLRIPVAPPLSEDGMTRVFHPGDGSPIVLSWDPAKPRPDLQLIDLAGRRIPITVSAAGTVLSLKPDRVLKTGIYIARVR